MSRMFTIQSYAVLCAFVLLCAATVQAGDGTPPSEETICDPLKDATPGLYGLCVAFNEAHDCEPEVDAEDPFEDCKPASRKIFQKYLDKMRPGDPYMPGIAPGDCMCFTNEDVEQILPTDGSSYYAACTSQAGGDATTSISSFTPTLNLATVAVAGEDSTCAFVLPDTIISTKEISGTEAVVCRTIIETAQFLTGLCPPE